MSEWIEIVIPTDAASADDVAAIVADQIAAARAGTQIRAGEVVFWTAIETSEEVLSQTRNLVSRMASLGVFVDVAGVCARPALPEAEWRDAWKRYFHVTKLTRQITIVPSWETHSPTDDEIVLDLDPGQAFGTGAHATTRLLLTELQRLCDEHVPVKRFLDIGTGSGILAIATAKLWTNAHGIATDIDSLAVGAATENCAANGVSDRVLCTHEPVAGIHETFDLVLANIQADVLIELAEAVSVRVRAGGRLLLSGLLNTQVEWVAAVYHEHHDLTVERIQRSEYDPEWAGAILSRSPYRQSRV